MGKIGVPCSAEANVMLAGAHPEADMQVPVRGEQTTGLTEIKLEGKCGSAIIIFYCHFVRGNFHTFQVESSAGDNKIFA